VFGYNEAMGGAAGFGEELEEVLAGIDLSVGAGDLPDESLRELVLGLRRVIDRLEASFADAVHTLGVRAIPAADGTVDATTWLVRKAGMSRSAARAATRLGAGLAGAPKVGQALHAGAITPDAARLLLGARNPRTTDAWERDEAQLVEWATLHTPDELRTVLRHWSAGADPDGPEPATDPSRNELTIAMLGGRGIVRGDLDAETAAIVNQAIADMVDELWRASNPQGRANRTAAWWRAEALAEIVRRASGVEVPGSTKPARPLVTVVVNWEDLLQPRGRLVALPTGELIGAEAVRRLACDAGVARVVMKGDSQPLEAGRAHRAPSAAQYRAVLARDRGCGLRGCGAPPWMCEVHHLKHWADGGPTDLSNLVMVCRREHRLAHEGGFEVRPHPDGGFYLDRPHARAA
jgi:hypothetical protein